MLLCLIILCGINKHQTIDRPAQSACGKSGRKKLNIMKKKDDDDDDEENNTKG